MQAEIVEAESRETEQMQLELHGEKIYIDRSRPRGNYTGERFARDNPQAAKIALRWLAAGHSFQKIADWLHVERRTIQAFYYANMKDVETQKETMRNEIFPTFMMAVHRTQELLPDVKNAKDAAVTAGIFGDKMLQLSGLPTAHVQHDHHFDFHAAIEELRKAAEEKMKLVRGRVIEPEALSDGAQGPGPKEPAEKTKTPQTTGPSLNQSNGTEN